jgi:hypothetical protein
MVPQKTDVNRVTIGPRTGNAAGTDAPVCSADVFDDDGLRERTSHPLGDDSRDHIRAAARSARHDHGDWPRRIGLRLCIARDSRERGSTGQMQKSTTRKVCCIHPERMALQPGLDWTTLRPPGF